MGRKFSGERLEKCRKAKGMSRQKLSQAIGFEVGPYTIERYERQGRVPNLDVAILLAKALGVSLKEFTDAPR